MSEIGERLIQSAKEAAEIANDPILLRLKTLQAILRGLLTENPDKTVLRLSGKKGDPEDIGIAGARWFLAELGPIIQAYREATVVRTPPDPKLDLLARVEALEEEVAAIYRTFNRMLGWKS